MYLYLESQLTEENLHLSYIVRPRALPSEYDGLRHDLEFVISNDCSTAASKRDSALVYSIIFSCITDDTAKTRVLQKCAIKNGRKLRHLRGIIKMGGKREPFHISVWKAKVDQAMTDFMSTGMEVDFAEWNTHLVNDESDYNKNNKNDYARISSASSGDRDEWLDSGEPTGPLIHNTEITVLYGNVSKLEEKTCSSLPRKTRQWFIDNPDLQCPAEFQSKNAPYNKKKKSTRNVSFAETDDNFSGGEYETDTEPSSAEDDNSST